MKTGKVGNDDKKRLGRNSLFAGFGARIVRSLFFWGLAAVLASSTYTGIVRITRERTRSADDETVPAVQQGTVRERIREDRTQESVTRAERKRAALTFDDGPHPVYTAELLDGLKERGVRATFFVVGKNIPGNEDLIRRMAEEGHLIGNHTYDHVKISDMNEADACEQIEKTNALILELTGKDTEFVRPPFGEWNKDLENVFVMIPVLWDVDPKDWTTNNVSDIVRRVLEDTGNGDIILLHDYYKSSVEAALQIVDTLQSEGYEFVTVDELILT